MANQLSWLLAETVKVLCEKVLLETSQNSHENAILEITF